MKKLIPTLSVAVIFAAAASTAAAVTVTQNDDAFDLAAALASPAVVGNFVERTDANQLGTFTSGNATIGFDSGIVLSTGNATLIDPLGSFPPYLSTDFAGSPTVSTAALVALIPGIGTSSATFDAVRFSLTVTPGLTDDFANFRFGYLTSEISPADVFGIFVDGVFTGYVQGDPIDQSHPWIQTSLSDVGFSLALFQDGLGSNPESFLLSLAVPNPGAAFDIDFVLVDAFDGLNDSAVFLGEFSLSSTQLGVAAVPEPGTIVLFGLGLAAVLIARRIRSSRSAA